MNAKKSVNRSKYWKGALQFAKRNTDDIEVVSPYNPLLDKYFDNQVDMISINIKAVNAITENQKVRKNNVEKNMVNSNSKTSVKELTEEECTEVEKHIKEVFQDLVTNKHNETYEDNKKMNKIKNKVKKEKQIEYIDIQLNNPLINSCFHERGENCNISRNYQNYNPLSYNRRLFEQSSMDFQRRSYNTFSMNIQRNSSFPFSMNDQRDTYYPFSIENHRDTFNLFSMNDSLFENHISFDNGDFGNHSLHSQRESINVLSNSQERIYLMHNEIAYT